MIQDEIYGDLLELLEMQIGVLLERLNELEKYVCLGGAVNPSQTLNIHSDIPPSPVIVEAASTIIFAAPHTDFKGMPHLSLIPCRSHIPLQTFTLSVIFWLIALDPISLILPSPIGTIMFPPMSVASTLAAPFSFQPFIYRLFAPYQLHLHRLQTLTVIS